MWSFFFILWTNNSISINVLNKNIYLYLFQKMKCWFKKMWSGLLMISTAVYVPQIMILFLRIINLFISWHLCNLATVVKEGTSKWFSSLNDHRTHLLKQTETQSQKHPRSGNLGRWYTSLKVKTDNWDIAVFYKEKSRSITCYDAIWRPYIHTHSAGACERACVGLAHNTKDI